MGVESYKHQFAKDTLAKWFREVGAADPADAPNPLMFSNLYWRTNRGAPNYGIWTEYPVCLDKNNEIVGLGPVWDEANWDGSEVHNDPPDPKDAHIWFKPDSLLHIRPPNYNEVIAMGLTPIVIFDVAIQHKGSIIHAFEVVHRNGITPTKREYLNRVRATNWMEIYTIDADWILSRVKRPDKLEFTKVF